MEYLTIIMIVILFIFLFKRFIQELHTPPPPTGVISGGVTYNGAPVVADVTMYTADGQTEIVRVTSGADGKYTLPAEGLNTYLLSAKTAVAADGTWQQKDQTVILTETTMVVDLVLERNNRLKIKIKKELSLMWAVKHIAVKLTELTDIFKGVRSVFHNNLLSGSFSFLNNKSSIGKQRIF